MRTLIFPDDGSRPRARAVARQQADALVVDTVLRELDLRLVTQLQITGAEVAAVAARSAQIADRVGELLPAGLRERPEPGRPAFWECYGEYFRSWSVAPLVANALLARRALEQHRATDAVVLECPASGAWWAYRQQILEAVEAALGDQGVLIRAWPGRVLRLVRALVAAAGGAWAAGAFQTVGGRQALRLWRWRRELPDPQPADVLFLAIGSTSVPIIDRLAPRLQERHGLSSAALMFHPSDRGMERHARSGVPYQYVDNFHHRCPQALGLVLHTADVLLSWPGWFIHACRQARRSDFSGLWPGLRNRLLIALARDSHQMLADMGAAGRILDRYRPRALVALHLYWHRIAPLVLAARARGIPVLYLQHGVYLAKDDVIRPLPYDWLMVFGQAAAEALEPRAAGAPVLQVGHCLYDDLASGGPEPGLTPQPPLSAEEGEHGSESDAYLCAHPQSAGPVARPPVPPCDHAPALHSPSSAARGGRGVGSPLGSGLVLVATQPDEPTVYDPYSERWWLKGVAEACADLGLHALLKLHPRETDAGIYERLAQQFPEHVTVLPHGSHDLADLLRQASVLVTRDSTVVYEANLVGTPVITVNLTGRRDRFPFAADGGARGVYEYEHIRPAVAEVVQTGAATSASDRARFLARHLGPVDGRATERVCEVIARSCGLAP